MDGFFDALDTPRNRITGRRRRKDSRRCRRRNRQLRRADYPRDQARPDLRARRRQSRHITRTPNSQRPGTLRHSPAESRVGPQHGQQPPVTQPQRGRRGGHRRGDPGPDRAELDRKRHQNDRPGAPRERPDCRLCLGYGCAIGHTASVKYRPEPGPEQGRVARDLPSHGFRAGPEPFRNRFFSPVGPNVRYPHRTRESNRAYAPAA